MCEKTCITNGGNPSLMLISRQDSGIPGTDLICRLYLVIHTLVKSSSIGPPLTVLCIPTVGAMWCVCSFVQERSVVYNKTSRETRHCRFGNAGECSA